MTRKLETGALILASHNRGKLREIAAMLTPYNIEVKSASEYGLAEPVEDGADYAANAIIKAKSAALATKTPALADDSGFEVAALDNAPGIFSARWAETPGGRDFTAAMQRIHDEVAALPNPDRACRFVCALSIVWPDGHDETFLGTVEGRLVWPPRGKRGFGYDPIFAPQGHDRTFGEMDGAEKDALSHRAIAFAELKARCLP